MNSEKFRIGYAYDRVYMSLFVVFRVEINILFIPLHFSFK